MFSLSLFLSKAKQRAHGFPQNESQRKKSFTKSTNENKTEILEMTANCNSVCVRRSFLVSKSEEAE